jgi:adenine-specific DNA methylase
MNYSEKEVLELMEKSFNAGFCKKDIVEAGLESKQADIEVRWILLGYNKDKKK